VIEPRNKGIGWEPTRSKVAEGHGAAAAEVVVGEGAALPPGSKSSARQHMPDAREPGGLGRCPAVEEGGGQAREGDEPQAVGVRAPQPYASEESDALVVPTCKKSANPWVTPGESMEGRSAANGKSAQGNAEGTQRPQVRRAHVTERIGERARREKGAKFTNLLSHMTVALLKEAYMRLRKDAAVGVDGVSWSSYGEQLDARLQELEERIHRGSYHPQPVRRVHIPKGDGRMRPLGVPALEDKIVQQAARMLLEPIYERSEFMGFSYGFRPGRSPHKALDALSVVLHRKRVNWVLDADIRSFFDTIDHGWMQKFIEHRIADPRMVRLLMKWLHAGVMEEGVLHEVEEGTPQGGIISPLMANIYLHYALDLWVHAWRKKQARGEVFIVRYADDFVMGFQDKQDALAMRSALAERLAKFGLELHPDKTRVIRFGRFAQQHCLQKDGRRRPETFDFLGFTHSCGKNRAGRFWVVRRTSRKKRQAKLAKLREELRRRRHAPVVVQHRRLRESLRGHYGYYGVPGNYRALATFRNEVRHAWHAVLQRRSQRARWTSERRTAFDRTFPLPQPRITRYPSPQLSLPLTGGGSPVREIRSPGSVRGAG
jgi:RNA-directed DNA polymerase